MEIRRTGISEQDLDHRAGRRISEGLSPRGPLFVQASRNRPRAEP